MDRELPLIQQALSWKNEEGKQRSIKIEAGKRYGWFGWEEDIRIDCISYDVHFDFTLDNDCPVFYNDEVLTKRKMKFFEEQLKEMTS